MEIHHPRKFNKTNFSTEEIKAAKDPPGEGREINEVSDLIFGELIHLLKNQRKLKKVEGIEISRNLLVENFELDYERH